VDHPFADFTIVLACLLVPVGGILLAHNFVLRRVVVVDEFYDRRGRYRQRGGWSIAGLAAWIAGAITFYMSTSMGGVLPSLAVTIVVYAAIDRYQT
jgi:cytosine/uracil/thiamine/allantoin permease